MAAKSYIPVNDLAFQEWLGDLLAYAAVNYQRWQVADPENILKAPFDDFKAKLAKANDANRGKVDVFAKNEARKTVEKEARDYTQGFLAKNKFVTNEDRVAMRLPVRDTTPTPVADPTGQAEATITYPGRTQLELRIKHVDGTPLDPGANYGYRIYWGIVEAGDPMPQGHQLRESRFTRRKKELFTFAATDSGRTACFCIRYENSKGAASPWGPVMSAIIP